MRPMKNLVACIFSALFVFLCLGGLTVPDIACAAGGERIIFLHHSTGGGVYWDGDVPGWFKRYNASHGTNYVIEEREYPNDPYPWENYPYDYWNLWINGACDDANPNIECLESLVGTYDVVIFKHCFPGAQLLSDEDAGGPSVSSSEKSLANYKLQYRALREKMDGMPDTDFIIWTLAPLHRRDTDKDAAARAAQFVHWVKNDFLTEDGKSHPNIHIFDFYGLAAETNMQPDKGAPYCLRYEYEQSHSDSDSHPNEKANRAIGPKFAEFIVKVVEE